jgi:ribosomal protein S12 methylthiotransferase
MKTQTYYLVSLGCAKNTVDSESMADLIDRAGYTPVSKPSQASVLIVNTCGFIQPAREESISVLKGLAEKKKSGQFLIAAGCLPQRYSNYLVEKVPEIDGILSTRRWMDIVDLISNLRSNGNRLEPLYHLPDAPTVGKDEPEVLRAAIEGGSAYLKIADGCRRPCAFCSIPLIKGTAVSRPLETIVQEAKFLADEGIQEINLIAQDTTDYGHDLGYKDGLAMLLEKITDNVPEIPWIRVLYAYPGYVTDRLIDVMTERRQIVSYLDMPLQHAHPDTLRRMRRPADMDWVYRTIEKIRSRIPDLALRTTFIVGYPGETEDEFQTLLDFVSQIKFDHLGAFQFSFEPGTASEPLGDPVPPEVKLERMNRLMDLQQGISLKTNQGFVGQTMQILIEGYNDGISVGRSYRDAPEIDGLVLAEGEAVIGSIVPVKITGAMVHDLSGLLIK